MNALEDGAVNSCPSLWGGSGREKKDNVSFVYLKGPRVVQNAGLLYAPAGVFMAWTPRHRIKQARG